MEDPLTMEGQSEHNTLIHGGLLHCDKMKGESDVLIPRN